jgi:hypothetical protein
VTAPTPKGTGGSIDEQGHLMPAAVIFVSGKKGSGKSVMAMLFASQWPGDMVVLDVAGDDGPFPRQKLGEGTHDIFDLAGGVDELPRTWPEHLRYEGRPMILRYVPDPGSLTEAEDMDAVVGLGQKHSTKEKPVMLLIHEIGRVALANRTKSHMLRVLNHSRHHGLVCVWCGPRPQDIHLLCIAQADLVYTFEQNQPADRKRIADNIGWNGADFDAAVAELGAHEYLRFDANWPKPEQPGDQDYRLVHYAALPQDIVDQVLRWRDGTPAKPE